MFPVSFGDPLGPDEVRRILELVGADRPPDAGPFDVGVDHDSPDAAPWAELAAAGATWWLQGFGDRPRLADVEAAAAAGPPQ